MLRRSLWRLMFALLLLRAMSAGQSSWEEKNQAGEKAFKEGRLLDASRLLNEALRDAQQFGPKDVRLAPVYNNLALVFFVQNNFIASETSYERAIAVMEAQGQENPLLLPVLDNLTSLYVKQWAFGKAIQTSERACRIREKKFGPTNLETADGLNKLATLYLDSVRLLPQSPSEKLVSPGPAKSNPADRNSACEPQGFGSSAENPLALDDATRLAIAESLFGRVLEVRERAYGAESTRLVDGLENFGEVLRAQGKIVAAEEAYTRIVSVVEKAFGPDDLRLATPLQQMAELKTEDGNYAEAENLYQRWLGIVEHRVGAIDSSLSAGLTGYAALLESMHKSQEAKNLIDRASSLAAPRPLKTASFEPTASVPYILRFEKSIYDRFAGARQTCILIRADGRFRVEEQQHERSSGPPTVPQQKVPDGMPDMTGLGPQETLNQSSQPESHSPRTFESSLDANALQQLRAILSAKEIRDIQGSYPSRGVANAYSTEKISASILRDDGVQNFAFPDTSARQPYESSLKPLLKWLSTAEKRKGAVVQGAVANNCSPDLPKAPPMQFSSSRGKPALTTESTEATESVANQSGRDLRDKVPTLKVNVNLVLVRVVVRDPQGRALGNLRQEDFRLLDNGKPQLITRFSLEQPGAGMSAEPNAPNGNPGEVAGENAKTVAAVERSVAYLFDDIHLNAVDLDQIRRAADRHLSSLQPRARAAIFTTSGETKQDFTDDRTKLHETLFRIQPRRVANSSGTNCPDIDTYMADLIWNKRDEDALGSATEDALVCAYGNDARFGAAAESLAKATAHQQIASAGMQGQVILGAFQSALRQLVAAPGRHTLVLVSPGFLLPGREPEFGQLINQALQSDIVISTLDARGLFQVDSADPRNSVPPQYRRESASANTEILTTLADATGGTAFQNSNDFATGFNRVADSPEYYYVLGFSPPDQELDGRFHKLAVALNGGTKLTPQARKGYYARKQ